jgi:LytS/YehU family sensor histidine kinase
MALHQIGFPVSNIDPVPGYQAYNEPSGPDRAVRRQATTRRTAITICTIADIAAGLLGLWILLFLLDANRTNVFVEFVRGTADWLSWWSQDIFTMDTEGLRVVLNYGLPAVIYLLIGHGIAARLNRA